LRGAPGSSDASSDCLKNGNSELIPVKLMTLFISASKELTLDGNNIGNEKSPVEEISFLGSESSGIAVTLVSGPVNSAPREFAAKDEKSKDSFKLRNGGKEMFNSFAIVVLTAERIVGGMIGGRSPAKRPSPAKELVIALEAKNVDPFPKAEDPVEERADPADKAEDPVDKAEEPAPNATDPAPNAHAPSNSAAINFIPAIKDKNLSFVNAACAKRRNPIRAGESSSISIFIPLSDMSCSHVGFSLESSRDILHSTWSINLFKSRVVKFSMLLSSLFAPSSSGRIPEETFFNVSSSSFIIENWAYVNVAKQRHETIINNIFFTLTILPKMSKIDNLVEYTI